MSFSPEADPKHDARYDHGGSKAHDKSDDPPDRAILEDKEATQTKTACCVGRDKEDIKDRHGKSFVWSSNGLLSDRRLEQNPERERHAETSHQHCAENCGGGSSPANC